jgi:hypothetical protein
MTAARLLSRKIFSNASDAVLNYLDDLGPALRLMSTSFWARMVCTSTYFKSLSKVRAQTPDYGSTLRGFIKRWRKSGSRLSAK